MKKFFSLVLALVMALSLTTVAWGVDVADATGLKDAVAAGGEIKLTGDIAMSEGIVIPENKTVTLDLNGKTLSFTNGSTFVTTIMGNMTGAIYVSAGATLTINANDGEISTANGNVQLIVNNGTLNINGGSYVIDPADPSYTGGAVLFNNDGATANINGATLTTNTPYNAVIMNDTTGIVTISGNTVVEEENANAWSSVENMGELTINGGTFSHTVANTAADADMTITDGIFNDAPSVATGSSVAISGGTFDEDVSEYVAPGYSFVGGAVKKTSSVGNTNTFDVKDLTITDPQGAAVPTTGITGFVKVASVTNTSTVNGVTKTTFVPAWYQVYAAGGAGTFVECDKSVADYLFTIKGVGAFYVREMPVPTAFDATPVALYTAPKTATCGMVGANEDVYVVVDGKYYPTKNVVAESYGLLNGNMVVFDKTTAATPKGHNFNGATVESYNTKYPNMVEKIKCPDCNGIVTLYTKPGSFDGNEYAKIVTTNTLLHSYTYYYIVGAVATTPSTGTTTGTTTGTVTSAETFDAGIAMYVGMSVMAAAGAVVLKKRED